MADQSGRTANLPLGDAPRRVKVRVMANGQGSITLGVNRIANGRPSKVAVDKPEKIASMTGSVDLTFTLDCQPDCSYVIYGRSLNDMPLSRVVVWLGEPEDDIFEDDAGTVVRSGWRLVSRPALNRIPT
jgi:hypothetical protein